MKKIKLEIPSGVRYLSDWTEKDGGYSLENYPFPHIVDKKITGCGFTEYCLTNKLDTVICSPRKILLENKEDQHLGEVFYFRNDLDTFVDFEKDISETSKPKQVKKTEKIEEEVDRLEKISKLIQNLGKELSSYVSRRHAENLPAKILVTYDSFRLVKDLLGKKLDQFYVVVDEFQSIFVDARFKSDTEMEFLKQLNGVQKVCYVSATPMIDKYLERMDEFRDLPFYEFDWAAKDPNRVIKPNLTVCGVKSITGSVEKIVNDYRDGKYVKSSFLDKDGKIREIESKEAVFYVNSVKNICDIIRKCELKEEECNVLCANTKDNLNKIKAAFKKHGETIKQIGKVPGRGEQHKMFTLCTRTVYLGADFYSTNARSFIFSDANVKSLSVDITLDLPQILGRQRLIENPWKNSATLYYRTISGINKMTKEDFDKELSQKLEKTERLLDAIDQLDDFQTKQAVAEKYLDSINVKHYKEDYVSVDLHEGKRLVPILNKLVMMAEERAFEIQQIDYKDRFSVMSTLDSSGNVSKDTSISDAVSEFFLLTTFPERMKFVCQHDYLPEEAFQIFLNSIPLEYKNYYLTLGPESCASFSYLKYRLDEEYSKRINNQGIDPKEAILGVFRVGEKYILSDIKEILRDIYLKLGLRKTPVATDLDEYFETKKVKISKDGKRENGFEILSIKSSETGKN